MLQFMERRSIRGCEDKLLPALFLTARLGGPRPLARFAALLSPCKYSQGQVKLRASGSRSARMGCQLSGVGYN